MKIEINKAKAIFFFFWYGIYIPDILFNISELNINNQVFK